MSEHKPVGGGMGATICSCGATVPTTAFDLHAGIIGHLVLTKRPRPDGSGFDYDLLRMRDGTSAAVTTLEGAQNVIEGRTDPRFKNMRHDDPLDEVEYVIGAITQVETK
ncbi:hypothetical protein [Mycobacterium sp. E1747]|uniref:hypothetical protein n=1 Tax=Mycobacterium sp. E1747 TaxID=1834128 RepID=UPI0008000A9A|nr:hypothetical protein [Mycobacterium sp. E1747]OBH08957.1 hypothetical protein A5695_25310 [Mycobacterium sp. E1747]